ncbi:hypothetical protein AVEN_154123-1 [Araneus ventricosus]|uniref:Uncharacterized protein n=1 Tax=Araneus ventricosus TaxID=182803 RepID=A0A4Y2B301_ARAVE|nr:hypothetical protein AVEN_154123-1 [Araneus ventricosus]
MFGINVEKYLTVDELRWILWFLQELLKKIHILSKITDEMENDDKEDDDDDTDPSRSLLTSQEPLQSVQSLRTFFSSFYNDHFCALHSC